MDVTILLREYVGLLGWGEHRAEGVELFIEGMAFLKSMIRLLAPPPPSFRQQVVSPSQSSYSCVPPVELTDVGGGGGGGVGPRV